MFHETIAYFLKGGLVMWPLLLCSVIVVAITVERWLYYREVDSGRAFTEKFCKLIDENQIDAAGAMAEKTKGVYAQIAYQAMRYQSYHQCSGFLETKAGLFMDRLRSKLSYLNVIVTLSPLLGLLGTIVGMIHSFSIFNLQEGQPMAITGGIGEALIATATGLCVAILALCTHAYLGHRMNEIITNMEQCFTALLEAKTRGGEA